MSVNVDQSFPEPKMTSSYDLFVHNPARLQCISILYCCNIKIFWYSIFLEHLLVQLLVGNKEQHEDISLSPRNIYIYNILTFYAFYKHWLIYWKKWDMIPNKYFFTPLSLTNPLWPEQFERDRGSAKTSRLGGDNDLSLVVFGRTHAAHYLAGRHPLGCQQAVMAADRQSWDGREKEKVKRVRDTDTQWQHK